MSGRLDITGLLAHGSGYRSGRGLREAPPHTGHGLLIPGFMSNERRKRNAGRRALTESCIDICQRVGGCHRPGRITAFLTATDHRVPVGCLNGTARRPRGDRRWQQRRVPATRGLAVATGVARVGGHLVWEGLRRRRATTSADVPVSDKTITRTWLTSVLCAAHPGATVESYEIEDVSSGTFDPLADQGQLQRRRPYGETSDAALREDHAELQSAPHPGPGRHPHRRTGLLRAPPARPRHRGTARLSRRGRAALRGLDLPDGGHRRDQGCLVLHPGDTDLPGPDRGSPRQHGDLARAVLGRSRARPPPLAEAAATTSTTSTSWSGSNDARRWAPGAPSPSSRRPCCPIRTVSIGR